MTLFWSEKLESNLTHPRTAIMHHLHTEMVTLRVVMFN